MRTCKHLQGIFRAKAKEDRELHFIIIIIIIIISTSWRMKWRKDWFTMTYGQLMQSYVV